VEPVRPALAPSALARGGARRGVSGFSMDAKGAPGAAASRAEATAELHGLIAVQERDEGERQDRSAHRRCQQMLRALAKLQSALLGVAPDSGALTELATLSRVPVDAANPELAMLSRMIAVRARVELARAEMVVNLKIAQQDRISADYHLGGADARSYKPPP